MCSRNEDRKIYTQPTPNPVCLQERDFQEEQDPLRTYNLSLLVRIVLVFLVRAHNSSYQLPPLTILIGIQPPRHFQPLVMDLTIAFPKI